MVFVGRAGVEFGGGGGLLEWCDFLGICGFFERGLECWARFWMFGVSTFDDDRAGWLRVSTQH